MVFVIIEECPGNNYKRLCIYTILSHKAISNCQHITGVEGIHLKKLVIRCEFILSVKNVYSDINHTHIEW